LRGVLEDSAERPRFIESLPRRGYRFVAPVTKDALAEPPTRNAPEVDRIPVHAREVDPRLTAQEKGAKRPSIKLATVLAIIIAAGAGGYGMHRWRSHTSHAPNFESLRFTKLTNSGKAEDVAISPDGSYVVYSQRDRGGAGLWLRHLASGSEVQILPSEDVDFRGLTFSPDGNSVYFVRTRKEIGSFKDLYAMPVLGGHPRLVTRDIDSAVTKARSSTSDFRKPQQRQFVAHTQSSPSPPSKANTHSGTAILRSKCCRRLRNSESALLPIVLLVRVSSLVRSTKIRRSRKPISAVNFRA
jgi:hypothetical protein